MVGQASHHDLDGDQLVDEFLFSSAELNDINDRFAFWQALEEEFADILLARQPDANVLDVGTRVRLVDNPDLTGTTSRTSTPRGRGCSRRVTVRASRRCPSKVGNRFPSETMKGTMV